MSLNAFCNLLILLFQTISLTSECPFTSLGLFCSTVRRALFFQFYRIIFLEYLTHVLNMMSNLSYISYSINRLFLVGQDHGKFVTMMSKMELKAFLLRTFMICLLLPISKMFTYLPNYYKPYQNYPDFLESHFADNNIRLAFIYLSFSIIYNMINSIGFILANLIVDLNLLVSTKKVLADRAKNTSRAIQANEAQKK